MILGYKTYIREMVEDDPYNEEDWTDWGEHIRNGDEIICMKDLPSEDGNVFEKDKKYRIAYIDREHGGIWLSLGGNRNQSLPLDLLTIFFKKEK